MSKILGGTFVNEIMAHTEAALFYCPDARAVLDIGGQDTKLVLLAPGEGGRMQVEDFALNSLCAAGTGAFLDQQAGRLGISIDEFSRLALKATSPARLAGRCTVFAKSDMIHLQQAAVPEENIIAGLCMALARNIKATLAKGRILQPPLVFQGGVAENHGVARALKEVFRLADDRLVIPPHFRMMGAIGAVIKATREEKLEPGFKGLDALEAFIKDRAPQLRRLPRLVPRNISGSRKNNAPGPGRAREKNLLLGVDVGSVSTKIIGCDSRGRIVASYYGPTAGRPIEALKKGLAELRLQLGSDTTFKAAGTTGSGRYLAADFIGADSVINEITAQAKAAMVLDPEVDTIFEIGGQDSKYIRIERGVVKDFMMNRACAAGTGSFLEEQATRLGVGLEEFGTIALEASSPVKMGQRCTVFMESDLVHYQQQGASTPDLVAGLCYAIAHNYMNKVVEGRPIGRRVFYQGATALNKGVVAAFGTILDRPVTVPDNCGLTGALGAALIAGERTSGISGFKGLEAADVQFKTHTFECKACPNLCSISKISIQGQNSFFYGGRCERYETGGTSSGHSAARYPDLVQQRQGLLLSYGCKDLEEARSFPKGPMGLPYALVLQEWLPFFATFLRELGYGPLISGPTSKALIRKGAEAVANEPCFPVKVGHGHVLELIEQGVGKIFIPAVIELPFRRPATGGQVCPYVQSFPYTVQAGVDFEALNTRLLTVALRMGAREKLSPGTTAALCHLFKAGPGTVARAWKAAWKAQDGFAAECLRRGREALEALEPGLKAVLLVGRPYNALDPGANLGVHHKLLRLGIMPIPMDHVSLNEHIRDIPTLESMYWRYGQKILAAAIKVAHDPGLRAIYITNFGCGPDSFLLHFFKDIMGDKPFLELEIDEHSADAGALTRIEAFLDTAGEAEGAKQFNSLSSSIGSQASPTRNKGGKSARERTVYIPYMCDHSHAVKAAMKGCGCRAEVLPATDEESLELGLRHTSGKECYPAVLTTGDLVKMINRPDFDPKRAAFFMPAGAGPCRFGQYPSFHRRVLDRLGLSEVPVISLNQDISFYSEADELGKNFPRLAWQGVVAVDLLDRMTRAVRPRAENAQEVNALYKEGLSEICRALESRGDAGPILRRLADTFLALKRHDTRNKPLIAVIGEIYTRVNPHANTSLVALLEELGAEVLLPSMSEWILYTNFTALRRARRKGEWKTCLRLVAENIIQIRDLRKLESMVFDLPGGKEQGIRKVLTRAKPFISLEYEGEAILGAGNTVDYIENGTHGIINVMPLSCMPGTITNALVAKIRKKLGPKPFLVLACDGQQETGRLLRLEAFVQQARQQHGSNMVAS
ncbi:2-hydroxyglutaryl-CoA dehydratase activator [Desulfolithobacter dissulfuricans]|uniref:2-hydroxyglutaryl-CoA dehydratase activator n=1 Tax=Desulfolithobacter dissulfuricans TaxID=2795293 RepID=A0A915UB49_9BACT|nr:2-hydroxyglutaryl-CoA dehydratase activator [Desulfolithobacter dissulfuricans]